MSKPVLVIGSGGHASVIIEILMQVNCKILGVVSKDKPNQDGVFKDLKWYKSDEDVLSFNKHEILLVNAIGFLPGNNLRANLHTKFRQLGYTFMTVIAPSAIVSNYVNLAQDVHLMPGCIINTNTSIAAGTILNSGSIVEHDCKIGLHNHIAPGAKLSGGVETGEGVFIGIGANVIQNIKICKGSVIAAGANVFKNIDAESIVYSYRTETDKR
ncbi:acetyltransferase [Gammaproteobacteria bacterium]|nr:acetyltransferase [Gammaproteobacteria bacterium]